MVYAMETVALFELPRTSAAFVYFATDLCNIKIGWSNSPRRRGGELQTHMLHSIPGSRGDERRHQRRWARYRIGNSEWFRPGGQLMLWLVTQLQQTNNPQALATVEEVIRSHEYQDAA